MASDSYSPHPEFLLSNITPPPRLTAGCCCSPHATLGIWTYSNERLLFQHTPEPTRGKHTFGEAGAAAARGGGDAQPG